MEACNLSMTSMSSWIISWRFRNSTPMATNRKSTAPCSSGFKRRSRAERQKRASWTTALHGLSGSPRALRGLLKGPLPEYHRSRHHIRMRTYLSRNSGFVFRPLGRASRSPNCSRSTVSTEATGFKTRRDALPKLSPSTNPISAASLIAKSHPTIEPRKSTFGRLNE
jgi:hypothetical protein